MVKWRHLVIVIAIFQRRRHLYAAVPRGDVRLCRHVVATHAVVVAPPTADDLAESLAELLRREVVDDRVDARVEVGEAVPDDADHRVGVGFG